MLEFEFTSKDTIAVWLPESPEKVRVLFIMFRTKRLLTSILHILQHVILTAAAKAGIKVVDIDLKLTELSEIREFLKAANCKAIYFKPEHEEHDYLLLLRQAIPEFFSCKHTLHSLKVCTVFMFDLLLQGSVSLFFLFNFSLGVIFFYDLFRRRRFRSAVPFQALPLP